MKAIIKTISILIAAFLLMYLVNILDKYNLSKYDFIVLSLFIFALIPSLTDSISTILTAKRNT